MELFDTHCHIHFKDYKLDADAVLQAAADAGVNRVLCVGCSLADSEAGVAFAEARDNVWMSVGLHPHEAEISLGIEHLMERLTALLASPKVVAIGEIGLDYYYNNSPKEAQQQLFRQQLVLAQERDMPVIFHVREAFDDFWPIVDEFEGLRGVVHSFSSNTRDLEEVLKRGFYVSLNGIMTFTKDEAQLEAAKAVPLDKLLLETDAPFLTPAPLRGTICEPKHVMVTAEFLSKLRGESVEMLSRATTNNGRRLFSV